MSDKQKPTHTLPGGEQEENRNADDGVVNDSLGKIDTADTTGIGEENQPGEESAATPRQRPEKGSSRRR